MNAKLDINATTIVNHTWNIHEINRKYNTNLLDQISRENDRWEPSNITTAEKTF